jgi:hypothetical protein
VARLLTLLLDWQPGRPHGRTVSGLGMVFYRLRRPWCMKACCHPERPRCHPDRSEGFAVWPSYQQPLQILQSLRLLQDDNHEGLSYQAGDFRTGLSRLECGDPQTEMMLQPIELPPMDVQDG